MTEPSLRWRALREVGFLRLALGLLCGALALGMVIQALIGLVADKPTQRLLDLHVYVGATRDLLAHGTPYTFVAANGDVFTYPPFAALLFAPLALIGEGIAQILWTVATLAAFGVIVWIVAVRRDSGLGPVDRLPTVVRVGVIGAVIAASSPFQSNLSLGQVSIFLILAVLLDVNGLVSNRFRGVLIGLAAAIKLTPLLFVPYLWFSGDRRAAIRAGVVFGVATGFAWVVLPAASAHYWLSQVLHPERITATVPSHNQSLKSLLERWGLEGPVHTGVWLLLALLITAACLWRARGATRAGDAFTAAIIVGAATVVLSPISWTHHQLWLLLAAFTSVSRQVRTNVLWATVVVSVMCLPLKDLPLVGHFLQDSHGLLAVAIAAFIPFRAVRTQAQSTAELPGTSTTGCGMAASAESR